MLKERRAFDEGESSWSSWSWVEIGAGIVEVNADKGLEPMFMFLPFCGCGYGKLRSQKVEKRERVE